MELKDLNHDERLALLGLMEEMVTADAAGSAPEALNVASVAEQLGENSYRECLDEAEKRFDDVAKLKNFLKTIERTEARNVIYATVAELAMSDTVASGEETILNWVADEWDVNVSS